MKEDEEREVLICCLERCLQKIFAEPRGASLYFATLYRVCFPFASRFVVGRTPNATMRWLFRESPLDAHVNAIYSIANSKHGPREH